MVSDSSAWVTPGVKLLGVDDTLESTPQFERHLGGVSLLGVGDNRESNSSVCVTPGIQK
jgi:hypothetical protein